MTLALALFAAIAACLAIVRTVRLERQQTARTAALIAWSHELCERIEHDHDQATGNARFLEDQIRTMWGKLSEVAYLGASFAQAMAQQFKPLDRPPSPPRKPLRLLQGGKAKD